MLSQDYNIIIYHGVSAQKHGIDMVYGLNFTKKSFFFQFI